MNCNQKVARNILEYYQANKAVGHTNAALNGFRNTENTLYMAANYSQTKSFGIPNNRSVTLQTVHDGKLISHREPLLIDHHTVCLILNGLMEDIEKLETQKENLAKQLDQSKLDEAADIHYAGIKLLTRNHRATLNQLLDIIEHRHGKDMIAVSGEYNRVEGK